MNTPHGAHVFDTLPLKRELRPLSEAVTGDPALSSPVKQAAQRAEFFDAYARQPFQQVLQPLSGGPASLRQQEAVRKARQKIRKALPFHCH